MSKYAIQGFSQKIEIFEKAKVLHFDDTGTKLGANKL